MTDPYVGKLTYFRVYSGKLEKGGRVLNVKTGRTERIGRLLMMHANSREEIEEVLLGRHLRRRRPQGNRHRRHARRPRRADRAGEHRIPGDGDRGRDRAENQSRPGEDGQRPAAPRRGGPDLPDRIRRGNRPDPDPRHGRAPPRGDRRPHAARVQSRRQRRQAAGRLPRDDPQAGREGRGALRPPDRRSRPVRPRRHQPRAGARRGLRVRQQNQGRRHPRRIHRPGRTGDEGGAGERRQGRLPDGRRQSRTRRRLLPRRRLLGDGLQNRRLDGDPGGAPARPTRSCSSR